MSSKSNLQVPPSWSSQERLFGDSLKENLDILLGHRGDPLNRAVTFKDLIDSGIVKLGSGVNTFGGSAGNIVPVRQDDFPDLVIPPAPTNLQASAAFQNIILTWDLSLYAGHSHVEVFRHTSDDISAASMVAQISGFTGVYADPVGGGVTRYYWVRAINNNDDAGPFNSSTGTSGTTTSDISLILNLLADQITSSELATDLSTPIGKVPTIESLLDNIEVYTGYTSAYSGTNLLSRISSTDTAVTSLNTSVSSINSSLTTLTGSVSNLQSSITDITANVGTVYVQTSEPTGTIATNSRWYDSDDNMAVYYYSGTAWVSLQDPRIAAHETSINALDAEVFNTDGSSKLASASAFNVLDTTVTNLDGTVTTVSSDVTSLKNVVFDSSGNSQIATTAALSNLTSQVTANDGDISALAADITSLEAEVFDSNGIARLATGSALSTLQTTVNTQGNSITTSQSDITALEGVVFDNSGTLTLATTEALTALTSTVTSQGNSISSTQSDVTALNGVVFDSNGDSQLATSAALTGLTSDVTAIYDGTNPSLVKTIQTDVTELEANVFDSGGDLQLATASALSGLTNSVEAIYDGTNPSVIKTIQGDVTDLETVVFLNGTLRLATASALSSLTTSVEAIYDGTNPSVVKSISEDVTSLNNAVFDANGDIELASASAVSLLQTEVWGTGVTPLAATSSRIDSLTSTINNPTTGLAVTSEAVGALNTEVFPNGSGSASSIDALESTVKNANLSLPFSAWDITGHSIETISDGKVGNEVLRLSGNAGKYPNQNNYIPIDATKKYQVRFWARPSSNTSGRLYFSLRQFTSPGTTGPNNSGRSPYKPSGHTRQTHNTVAGTTDDWYEYVYIWDSSDWQTGVKYFQPDFLDNYSGQSGYWEIQGFVIHEVSELEDLSSTTSTALSALNTEVYGPGGGSSSRIDALETTVNHPTTGLSVTSQALSTLSTTVSDQGGDISTNATDITALETTVNHPTTGLSVTSQALGTLTSTVSDQGGDISANASDITALETTVNHADTGVAATSSALSDLSTTVSTQGGSITANAESLSTLSTTVGGNTSSISTQATSIDGLEAKYTVKVDTNGAVAGFGLASTDNGFGNITSEFVVNADRFAIMRGGSNTAAATVPFVVQASQTTLNGETVPAGVYMDDAFIKNGSIESAKIGTLAVDKLTGTMSEFESQIAGTISTSRLNLDDSTITSVGGVVQIASLGVNAAHIENLSVSTIKIADNAATLPMSALTLTESILSNSTDNEVQSLTHVTIGGAVEIMVSLSLRWVPPPNTAASSSTTRPTTVALYAGNTVIFTTTVDVGYVAGFQSLSPGKGAVVSFAFLHTPSAGSVDYSVKVNPGSQPGNTGRVRASNRYLRTLELRK